MLHRVTSMSKKSSPSLASAVAAALLCLAAAGARAQDDPVAPEVELDTLSTETLDQLAYATLLPNPDVADPALMRSAIAAAMAAPPAKPKTIVPTGKPVKPAIRPVVIDPNAVAVSPTKLVFDNNLAMQVHADGAPAPNGPDRDPLVRVLPAQADPAAVTLGARWTAEDRIQAPVLSALGWEAHADLVSGAPAPRAGNVRRSLRITAMWDTPEDLSIGFTPGWTRGGGREFEHYETGFAVSTVDKTKTARWRSYVEVSGEKLTFNNVIDNSTAHVAAGASYAASASTQLDIGVSRGTTWTSNDLTSNVGLSVRF